MAPRTSGSALYRRGVVALVVAFLALHAYRAFRRLDSHGWALTSMAVFWWLSYKGLQWLRLGRRALAIERTPDAVPEVASSVLYLRAFQEDEAAGESTASRPLTYYVFGAWSLLAFKTEEEQLATVLGRIGPMVAVGRPGETLPQLGAHRQYLDSADWQPVVGDLMRRAALVVIRASQSAGLRWELAHASTAVEPTRLLLLITQNPRQYRQWRREVEGLFPKGLPGRRRGTAGYGSIRGVVWFERDWQPHYEPVRPSLLRSAATAPLEAGLLAALRPVLVRAGLVYRKPPLRWYLVLGVGLTVVMLISLLVRAVLG